MRICIHVVKELRAIPVSIFEKTREGGEASRIRV